MIYFKHLLLDILHLAWSINAVRFFNSRRAEGLSCFFCLETFLTRCISSCGSQFPFVSFFWLFSTLLEMSQVGANDLPGAATQPSPPTTSPSESQTTMLSLPDASPSYREDNGGQEHISTPPSVKASGEIDDEVQFVFSAPRRRKKKRKRYEHSGIPLVILTTCIEYNPQQP